MMMKMSKTPAEKMIAKNCAITLLREATRKPGRNTASCLLLFHWTQRHQGLPSLALGANIRQKHTLGANIRQKQGPPQPTSLLQKGRFSKTMFFCCKSYRSPSWAVYKEVGPVWQCCIANLRLPYSKNCPHSISIQQNSNCSRLQSIPAFGTILGEVIQGRTKICIFSVLQLSPKLIEFKYRNVTFPKDKHRSL